ncbi:MAG: GreA/GreB family elongation factor [Clostridiaceae bacterium]|nr:GreA/GreB family elongation factor [Clostridiaceae bacterium]
MAYNKLTLEDVKEIREEYEYRSSTLKAQIAIEKMTAAAHGDRSENAEYKEAMRNYHKNQSRLEYLSKMLNTATIIDDTNLNKNILHVNSVVMIKFVEENELEEIVLTTTLKANPSKYLISIESPLGSALLGKKVGDEVKVDSPEGVYSILVHEIIK